LSTRHLTQCISIFNSARKQMPTDGPNWETFNRDSINLKYWNSQVLIWEQVT
jgi:hypothetical protein